MNREERVKVDSCVINEKDLESLKDLLKNGYTFRKNINEVLLKVISYFEKYNDEKVLGPLTKEERVKLVFETISKIAGFEITPDKDFHMFGNGIDGVYQINDDLNLYYKTYNDCYKASSCTISWILKGAYQFKEIKEPLTTEEEKNFLRHFKFDELVITDINLIFAKNDVYDKAISLNIINFSFGGLEKYKNYSREELGL